MNCKIFISYRRADTEKETEWLYNELNKEQRFQSILFKDTKDIRTGDVWSNIIEKRLGESEIVLAIVGPKWMAKETIGSGNQSDQKLDWVLKELETAHNDQKIIIPVFVNGTPGSVINELPDSIKFISTIQNYSIQTEASETNGIKKLISLLKEELDNSGYIQKKLATKLKGRYAIKNKIGKSVMTQVFYAEDSALDRVVAIKAITDPSYQVDFSQTVRDALRISENIPNSVQILDAGLDDDLAHVVTPFLNNGSLRREIFDKREIGLPLIKCHSYMINVGEALIKAHNEGFCHLNVKPSNVVLGGDVAYLSFLNKLPHLNIDYIRKKFAPEHRDTNEMTYKEDLCYIAPDIVEINHYGLHDKKMNQLIDQYMLGLLGYELLTGILPATIRSNNLQKDGKITFNRLNRVDTIRKDCPVKLANIIQKMIDLNPRNRYPDMEAAIEEIRQTALGETEVAKDSYARCISGDKGDNKFFQVFYSELIRISKDAADKFRESFSNPQKKEKQYEMLKQAIFILLFFAERPPLDDGPNILTRIAISHKRTPLQITPEMYDDFCVALTNTVCGSPPNVTKGFDKNCRNRDERKRIKEAWAIAMAPGLKYMKDVFYRKEGVVQAKDI